MKDKTAIGKVATILKVFIESGTTPAADLVAIARQLTGNSKSAVDALVIALKPTDRPASNSGQSGR